MSSSSVSLGRNLVSLKWEDFNTFVVSELAALYQKDDLTDVTLFCEGRSFRAHKVLLSLWSTYFRDVFRSTSHSHPVVILRDTSSSDLELILRFIYQGHLLIPMEETDRFLKTAEYFQVAGLKNMRHHVPNFQYSGGNGMFQEDNNIHQQPVHNTVFDVGTAAKPHSTSSLSAPTPTPTQPGNHNRMGSNGSVHQTTVVHSTLLPNSNNPGGNGVGLTQSSHASQLAESSNQLHHNLNPDNSNQQQQVIRQSSARSTGKHGSSAYLHESVHTVQTHQQTSVVGCPSVSSPNSGGVVTRLSSDSMMYQPQPVLIFQSNSSTPLLKSGEQYVTTRSLGGGEGRAEHSMMLIEGVLGDSSVRAETPPSSTNHTSVSSASAGTAYAIYTHSSASPHASEHHSSSDVSGGDEAILGLPYNAGPSHTIRLPQHQTMIQEATSSSTKTHVTHHHQHIETHPSTSVQVQPESVVVSHSYTTPPPPHLYESLANGNGNSGTNSGLSPISSKPKSTSSFSISNKDTNSVHAAPVYAVKRLPPPLSPTNIHTPAPTATPGSSAQSRNFKSIPAANVSKGKSSLNQGTAGASGSTLSKAGAKGSPGKTAHANSSAAASSSAFDSTKGVKSGIGNSSGGPTRKVVLVSCPKCGKKVKQTSLKVHMKRTHLEEGTELVCPICSKRIGSKGVYYKHMYIHRKRSETDKPSTNFGLVKSETQGV